MSTPTLDLSAWSAAVVGRRAPLLAVDLDAFDANAADLVRRAAGMPIRVASKSVRVRSLVERALGMDGFAGVMGYNIREGLWLAEQGIEDVYIAYPSVDAEAITRLAGDATLRSRVTLTVDSIELVDLLHRLGAKGVRVAVDVDASLRVGPVHIGARRSPLRAPEETARVARAAADRGLAVVGIMFYDAQIAGVPDSSPAVRIMKRRSDAELRTRRSAVVAAVREVTDLEFVNGGGTGSLHVTHEDTSLTELAAGSGLFTPTLFDGYDSFEPRPAMAFALPVVRRPASGYVTCFQGGYIASGPAGQDRVPVPVWPTGLELVGTEGTGEVQTPLKGDAADRLAIGDLVWFRHAKAGEVCERFDEVVLLRGGEVVDVVPTYRGEGTCFG
ncbi:amino acid deaminase/aldolase [Janibacter sp. YIM B02568]|uniref:amino acid deaminase/aldolase n=1 Tax=Janibacter endophyticus TaxID=2806261 RepID=UPI00194F5C51|nr:amino acid deaminase/aldolase [Janibacter endophyticus]MBM6545476.1 amino acid deaminase/aldolase [Janibacter endophyticus]